jgi:DNA polymerase type B, organellar and viral
MLPNPRRQFPPPSRHDLRDTILLTDEKASLEQLGHTLGMPKLPLPSGARWDPATTSWQDPYTKARMDIFLQDRPAEFMRYGERDAVIAARYFTSLLVRFQKERLKFHVPRKGTKAYEKASERDFWNDPLMPATTGAWGVKELLHIWREHSLEIDKRKSFLTKDAVLGLVAASTYNQRTGRYHTKRVHTEGRSNVEDLAAKCYHGGRGEAFYYGLSPEDDWTDYDISGAYTASLSAVRMPDWDRAYHCLDPQEYTADTLGYALVNFEFPPDTLYPCLPVKDRLEPDSGMIFPLRGRTHATAPDIATALWIGARVEIVTGWIIPYVEDWIPFFGGYRPFADFTKVVRMRRAEAQAAGDMVGDKVWKLLGNSVYGKLGQGFRGTKAYNPETGKNELIGKCKITIAALAAHATGLTRAVMGEVLHRLPPGRTALNCVTDGLLTNALLEELHLEGPAGRVFKEAAGIVTPGAPVLEAKHTDLRVLVWRKRGHVGEGEDGVLAKGGLQADRDLSRTEVQAWVQQLWREREPDQRVVQTSLDSLRTLMETGRDMQDVTRLVRLNMDFDMNRQPFEPRDEDGLLVFSTRPWNDLGEWRTERKRVRDWYKSGRILKSLADWKAFMGVRRRNRNHTKQPRVYSKTSS